SDPDTGLLRVMLITSPARVIFWILPDDKLNVGVAPKVTTFTFPEPPAGPGSPCGPCCPEPDTNVQIPVCAISKVIVSAVTPVVTRLGLITTEFASRHCTM